MNAAQDEIDRPIPQQWSGWSVSAYRLVRLVYYAFGLIATLGAIGFLIFACYFFAAFRGGSTAPSAEQTAIIRDHSDVRYVKPAVAQDLRVLQWFMLCTLGVGVPGGLLANTIAKRLREHYAPPEAGPNRIELPPRTANG